MQTELTQTALIPSNFNEAVYDSIASHFSRYDFKVAFLDQLLSSFSGRKIRLLDLGCGSSKDFPEILRKYSNVYYVGVEQNLESLHKAETALSGLQNVRLIHGFGEELLSESKGSFDLVLSLSVLEHVKRLQSFLKLSVEAAKRGGLIVHRYDLGHAYHSSFPERLKTWITTYLPQLFPASSFTFKPNLTIITTELEKAGARVSSVESSQMNSLKRAMNFVDWQSTDGLRTALEILKIDREVAAHIVPRMNEDAVERLFPTVTVTAERL